MTFLPKIGKVLERLAQKTDRTREEVINILLRDWMVGHNLLELESVPPGGGDPFGI